MATNPHSSPTPIPTYTLTSPTGNISIAANGNTSGMIFTSNIGAISPYTFTTTSPNMVVNGTMQADDYMIQGQSIKNLLEKINERLAILVPDSKKLEKYAALKEAYEHYKLLEKLCSEPDK